MKIAPALLLVALLGLCASLRAQTLTITPDKADPVYARNETATWTISVTEPGKVSSLAYTLKSGGLNTVASGTVVLNNGQATLQGSLPDPGWLLLELTATTTTNTTVKAASGAMIAPLEIAAPERPADFKDFWDTKIAALNQIPINAVETPGTSDRSGVSYSTITLDCINGSKVRGQIAKPSTGEKFPGMIIFQWAGVYSLQKSWATGQAANGWLVLNTQAHDIEPIADASYYSALDSGALSNYPRIGNESRETSYFLRMYLACHRAIEYFATRPDWDGRTLILTGASQGGLQSLMAAGLNHRVSAVLVDVPAGSDQTGLDQGRVPGWPMWAWQAWDRDLAKVKETARYFDVTNFAQDIQCPVLIGVGLIDTVVPPPGVYATYNRITSAKRLLLMPKADHQNNHDPYWPVQWNWLTDILNRKLPSLTTEPADTTAPGGGSTTLQVEATNGQVFSYQWYHNGEAIAKATSPTLKLSNLHGIDEGSYTVVVTSPSGQTTSREAVLTVTPRVPFKRLINISGRSWIGTGSSIGVGGFVLDRPAKVLVRGVGPSLSKYGVGGLLQQPKLRLFNSKQQVIAENQGWHNASGDTAGLQQIMRGLQAFDLDTEQDSVLYVELPAGLYTAQLSGGDAGTGNGLMEVYLDHTQAGLVEQDYFLNISNRSHVGVDDSVAVAGFVLAHEATVLIRALGPSLGDFGVADTLAEPELKLFDGQSQVTAANTGWKTQSAEAVKALSDAASAVGAFPLAHDADSALLLTLPSGQYTAQVSGKNQGTGNALVEVYLVD